MNLPKRWYSRPGLRFLITSLHATFFKGEGYFVGILFYSRTQTDLCVRNVFITAFETCFYIFMFWHTRIIMFDNIIVLRNFNWTLVIQIILRSFTVNLIIGNDDFLIRIIFVFFIWNLHLDTFEMIAYHYYSITF